MPISACPSRPATCRTATEAQPFGGSDVGEANRLRIEAGDTLLRIV